MPLPPPLPPPPLLGGATADPRSKGPLEPPPFLPRPRPPSDAPAAIVGGGGTTLPLNSAPYGAFKSRVPPCTGGGITALLPNHPETNCLSEEVPACGGGGTMLFLPDNPATNCLSSGWLPPDTGGATTCVRGSTAPVPPTEPRSRAM